MEFTVRGVDTTTGESTEFDIEADSAQTALSYAESELNLALAEIVPDVEPPVREQSMSQSTSTSTKQSSGTRNNGWRRVGFVCFVAGAAVLLFARGWGSLQHRALAADAAEYQVVQSEFRDVWQDKRTELEAKNVELREKMGKLSTNMGSRTPNDERQALYKKQREVQQQLSALRTEESKERLRLTRTDWKDLRTRLRRTNAGIQGWDYTRQWLAVLGVWVFGFALVVLAKYGTKSEMLLSLVLLGVVVYSLFVGGSLWGDSQLNDLRTLYQYRGLM